MLEVQAAQFHLRRDQVLPLRAELGLVFVESQYEVGRETNYSLLSSQQQLQTKLSRVMVLQELSLLVDCVPG
jgi:hypothetical protein